MIRCKWLGLFALLLLSPASSTFAADLASFERKAEMNASDPQAQFNLGVVAYQAKALDKAEAALKKTVALSSQDAEAWELYGTVLAERKKDAEAVKALGRAVELEPKRLNAWTQLGRLQALMGGKDDLGKAVDAYEHAVKLKPSDARLHLNLGLLFAKQGRDEDALGSLEKAAKMPEGQAAYRTLCVLYNKAGTSAKAVAACETAAKVEDKADNWYNLGFAQQRLGKGAEARKAFQKAIKADAAHAPSLYNLAFLDFEAGDAEKAIKGFQAAIAARNSDYPEAEYNAAVLLGDLGRYEEAGQSYRALLKKDPANADAKANLAFVVSTGVGSLMDLGKDSYERGEFEGARKAWERALKLDPGNDQATKLLKQVQGKAQGDKTEQAARQAAKGAVDKKLKAEDEKLLKQGLAAFKAGKHGQAVRLLDYFLKKNKGDKGAQTTLVKARALLRQKVDGLLQEAGRELVAGHRDKAHQLAAQALAEDAGNARARKMMGQAGKAEPKAVDAGSVRSLYYAGVEQYLQGDLQGAVNTWKRVLVMDAEHLDAKRSITRAQMELEALKKRAK